MENKIDVRNLLKVIRYYTSPSRTNMRKWDIRAVEIIDNEGKERDGGIRRTCDTKKEAKRVCREMNADLTGGQHEDNF